MGYLRPETHFLLSKNQTRFDPRLILNQGSTDRKVVPRGFCRPVRGSPVFEPRLVQFDHAPNLLFFFFTWQNGQFISLQWGFPALLPFIYKFCIVSKKKSLF